MLNKSVNMEDNGKRNYSEKVDQVLQRGRDCQKINQLIKGNYT